jgi:hypothetical protein
MCAVQGVYKEWREIVVLFKPRPRWKFNLQANTFKFEVGKVEVKVCERSNEGIVIRSWVERDV